MRMIEGKSFELGPMIMTATVSREKGQTYEIINFDVSLKGRIKRARLLEVSHIWVKALRSPARKAYHAYRAVATNTRDESTENRMH